MPLIFPILVNHLGRRFYAQTPALPGWAVSATSLHDALEQGRAALEDALIHDLEPTAVPSGALDGHQVFEVTVDEPADWWDKDPSE